MRASHSGETNVPHQYEIKPFKAKAFKGGKFIDVSEESLKDIWSVFFFYPADFTFVCPTELEDLAENYHEFQKLGVEIFAVSTDTHSATKPGMTLRRRSAKSTTPWSATHPPSLATSTC